MKIYIFLISLVFGVFSLTACKNDDVQNAVLVVESFHNKFNSKDFNGIYADVVSKEFKNSMTRADYLTLMDKNFSVLGKYRFGRVLKSDQVKVLIGEDKINISYHSTYTNYELNELFVIKKEGGKSKIAQIVYDDIHAIKLKD
ncbi:hypothetical protein FNI64_23145 [Salmonella enterica subsp. salamae]|nr:hypothetical protein [Salmonella enterica subsp. salamae]